MTVKFGVFVPQAGRWTWLVSPTPWSNTRL